MPSPAPVGTVVTWTASASGSSGGAWYRFRARELNEDYHVVKDYGPGNTLDWTADAHEGFYEIEVTARSPRGIDAAVASEIFEMQPIATGDQPVISRTSHPLVFLYSAPGCAAGSRMRVAFRDSLGRTQSTHSQPCQDGKSMNFYIAGLQPAMQYSVRHAIATGSDVQAGPLLDLVTPDAGSEFLSQSVIQPRAAPVLDGVLLQAAITSRQVATDLDGNVIWYYPGKLSYITRPEPGGRFFGVELNPQGDASQQMLREFDLAGMTLLETNAARVSEQLAERGMRPITSFHHEVRRMSNGSILALASTEQILKGVQGPDPVDVVSDMIVVLNPNLELVWAWDAFDHLDPRRLATQDEKCPGGCPPLYLASVANDWTHANAVQETPDGNLLLSVRHQDWVIKIDYAGGAGSGDVIWRLGKDGDFTIVSDDPLPWFSHQHDPQILSDGSMTLFDNGNNRHVDDPSANSRGQVLQLDEQNRVATLSFNVDLGMYCFALGAAQRLPNGNYHFHCGWLDDSTTTAVELDPSGNPVFSIHTGGAEYRSFRMRDMYTP